MLNTVRDDAANIAAIITVAFNSAARRSIEKTADKWPPNRGTGELRDELILGVYLKKKIKKRRESNRGKLVPGKCDESNERHQKNERHTAQTSINIRFGALPHSSRRENVAAIKACGVGWF